MTKKELIEALSYHGWEKMEGKETMEKRCARIDIYDSESGDYRGGSMVYFGADLSFNAPLLCADISGNRLRVDWNDNIVEVWI